jgi:glyoxalase family protein
MSKSAGIHHITAIAGEPKRHVDFYARKLGLRFVKRTVNFDDPTTWHLYYGDEVGHPGTALTFFIWHNLPKGRHGTGEAQEVAFSIPEAAMDFWLERLDGLGIAHSAPTRRFGESAIAFEDPDGLKLELVADPHAARIAGWSGGDVPAEHAIRGFYGITLEVPGAEATGRVLERVFGFRPAGVEHNRHRFVADGTGLGRVIDLRITPGLGRHLQGLGTNHHVAFRAANDAEELEMRGRALALGLSATEQIDRNYFRSVYFREPQGILFEIATDEPGFTIDEAKETLGKKIMLPPWYEQHRKQIEAALPALA